MSDPHVLTRGQVHLWYTLSASAIQQEWLSRYDGLLSRDERVRHQRFVFQKDRDQYLIACTLLRTTLSRYSKVPPGDWRFERNEFGKPAIEFGRNSSQLRFNLSHCNGLLMCAVTVGCDIGVDCENVNRQVEVAKLVERVFSTREKEYFNGLPALERTKTFFRIWTLKEAYIKARGLGLSLPLHSFSFDLTATNRIPISFSLDIPDQPQAWQVFQPTVPEPFVAALAVNIPHKEKLKIELFQAYF